MGVMHFKISKGLDLPVEGAPAARIDPGADVASVALSGSDYVGLEPRLLVAEGDTVLAGQPVFSHKRDPDVLYTAPGSGRVVAIHRGARRVLKSVVIELDETDPGDAIEFKHGLSDSRSALLQAGLWSAFRTRPFGRIPHSKSQPRAIFVTAMDTRPLSGDPTLIIAGQAGVFARGLEILRDLSDADVYLCSAPGWQGPEVDGVSRAEFAGPHPAGLAGTHIHHLEPAGADRTVWYLGWQDVIAIGRLFQEGQVSMARTIALGGKGFRQPRWVQTRTGADLKALCLGEAAEAAAGARLISGSVLCGREVTDSQKWLGRYHDQVSAIPAPEPGRRLRWRRLFDGRYSFAGTFARKSGGAARSPFTTEQNGRATALVPIDAFEKLIPMDILAEPLLRSLLIGDTDQAQALGALELVEEDLALCTFVCPGKNDYGNLLRVNLGMIEQEG